MGHGWHGIVGLGYVLVFLCQDGTQIRLFGLVLNGLVRRTSRCPGFSHVGPGVCYFCGETIDVPVWLMTAARTAPAAELSLSLLSLVGGWSASA